MLWDLLIYVALMSMATNWEAGTGIEEPRMGASGEHLRLLEE
jgi:hypothetical protein